MAKQSCSSYQHCEAVLCHLDPPEELAQTIWYPDEDVCSRPLKELPGWIRTQRKIARRVKDKDTYFTVAMLNVISKVTPQLTGLPPNTMADGRGRGVHKWQQRMK